MCCLSVLIVLRLVCRVLHVALSCVACCVLFAVCCLLFAVLDLLCLVCCLLLCVLFFDVFNLVIAVGCLLFGGDLICCVLVSLAG